MDKLVRIQVLQLLIAVRGIVSNPVGINISAKPTTITMKPIRIMFLSPSRSAANPHKNLPTVIPMYTNEANFAAVSLLIPRLITR